MVIKFADIGSSLGTRELGAKVREEILNAITNSQEVTFDMSGVEVVSNSFADECFAKLLLNFELSELKKHTHFKNAEPFVNKVIANAFKGRMNQLVHA
jgi:hypothetical protein